MTGDEDVDTGIPALRFYGSAKFDGNIRLPPSDSEDSLLEDSDDGIPGPQRRKVRKIVSESESSDNEDDKPPVKKPARKKKTGKEEDTHEPNDEDAEESIHYNGIAWKTLGNNDVAMDEYNWTGQLKTSNHVFSPLDYFFMFIGEELLDLVVEESNRYSVQKNPNKPLQLTREELEIWMGIVLCMSIIKLPATRLYWSIQYRVPQVADHMSVNRFEAIKANIHFSDNLQIKAAGEPGYDRLYKIRPLLDHVVSNCKYLPKCEKYSVDEQVVPFKGRSGLKQYNPKKPKKWGYKLFVLCDVTGLVYNFELYTGKEDHPPDIPNIGASGNVVMRLASVVPQNENCKLYFDNWFCSLPLQVELAKSRIWSLGTVRQNRLKGCNLDNDAQLKKQGRGSSTERRCKIDGVQYSCTKWFDNNRCVTLLSNFAGVEPVHSVKRYDRKTKSHRQIQCPNSLKIYNKFMGGVDLVDSVIALYRTTIRSKKWYHRLFFHILDLMCVNAWFLYRRDLGQEHQPMPFLQFKTYIFQGLLKENKSPRKAGRPSQVSINAMFKEKQKRGPASVIPIQDVRLDGVGHFPEFSEKKGRCKRPECKGTPKVWCSKCELHLCFTPSSNCFLDFHTLK